ncbi:hypothetical protein ABGV42_01585 [Paenibacillus pabuli]|uniref:hypothetical protein n=1 Tax=Paenibacillus pabuli TaxID=1472 RepID=UPI003242AD37
MMFTFMEDGQLYSLWQGDEMGQLAEGEVHLIEDSLTFEKYIDVVKYFKNTAYDDITVYDLSNGVIIRLQQGKFRGMSSESNYAKAVIRKYWEPDPDEFLAKYDELSAPVEDYDDDPPPRCTFCGDGGCPNCRPSWFN